MEIHTCEDYVLNRLAASEEENVRLTDENRILAMALKRFTVHRTFSFNGEGYIITDEKSSPILETDQVYEVLLKYTKEGGDNNE